MDHSPIGYPKLIDGGIFHKYSAIFMEIMYQIENTKASPAISRLCEIFANIIGEKEVVCICRNLRDFDICDYEPIETEGNTILAIKPTDKGTKAFGVFFDLWQKYREMILAGMDAKKIILCEIEYSKNSRDYFTEKGFTEIFKKVFTPDELKDLVEWLIAEDVLDAVDHELIYLSSYGKITPAECAIWQNCRGNLLAEGF